MGKRFASANVISDSTSPTAGDIVFLRSCVATDILTGPFFKDVPDILLEWWTEYYELMHPPPLRKQPARSKRPIFNDQRPRAPPKIL